MRVPFPIRFKSNGVFGHIWKDPEMGVKAKVFLFVYLGVGSVIFPIWIFWRYCILRKPLPEPKPVFGWNPMSLLYRKSQKGAGKVLPATHGQSSAPTQRRSGENGDDLPTPEFLDDYAALVDMPESENPDLYKRVRVLIDRMHEDRAHATDRLEAGKAFAAGLYALVDEYRKMQGKVRGG